MNLKGKRTTRLLVVSMTLTVLVANVLLVSAAKALPPADHIELWLSDPIDNTDEFSSPLPNSNFDDGALRDRGAGWALLGDADFDGDVDLIDFTVWADNYGKHEGEWDPSIDPDLDDNGIVDEADYDVWDSNNGAFIDYVLDTHDYGWSWYFSEGRSGSGESEFWLKNWVNDEELSAIIHSARDVNPDPVNVAFGFLFHPWDQTGAHVVAEVEVFYDGGGSNVFSSEPFYFSETELEWTEVVVTAQVYEQVVGIKVKIGGEGWTSFRAWIDEAKFTISMTKINSHDYGRLSSSVNVLAYEVSSQPGYNGRVVLGIAIAADSLPWVWGEPSDWILKNIMIKVELLPNDGAQTTQPGQLTIRWLEHGNDKGYDLSPSQIESAHRTAAPIVNLALGALGSVVTLIIFPPGAFPWWYSFLFASAWRTGQTVANVVGNNLRTTYEHLYATGGSDYAVWENWDYFYPFAWAIKTAYGYLEVDWVFNTRSLDPTYAVKITAQAMWLDDILPDNYRIEETTTVVRVARTYELAIQADTGGTTSPSPGTHQYDPGEIATVTALDYTYYDFDYWTLDGTIYDYSPTTSVPMNDDHTLKAWFHYIGSPSCVAEGTLVTMADGSTKPIEKIKKGDQVLGYDPTTGSYMTENVLDTMKHQVEAIVNINNGMLKLTPLDQPIFIRNSTYEGWMRNPVDIQVGWEIYEAQTNGWVPVSSVTYEEGKTRVYDMVLDGYTTYIANGILLMDKPAC